jgi:hypothetical protein
MSVTRHRGDDVDDVTGFSKLVPGFDFLQGLVKNAGAALPGIGQWVAPTLDPAELEKRIGELRTVQYWLEQNARMLSATIQALEVQRMTLSTLKTMNVQMSDLGESLKVRPSAAAASEPKAAGRSGPASKSKAAVAAVDPMQWWSALTGQFTQLATSAMKDTATEAAKTLAGKAMKQSFDAATQTVRQVATAPARAAAGAARSLRATPAAKRRAAPAGGRSSP